MTPAEAKFVSAMDLSRLVSDTVNNIVHYFEETLGMEVSAAKSKVTSSPPAVSRLVQSLVRGGKVSAINARKGETAKMLGVGTNGGASLNLETGKL